MRVQLVDCALQLFKLLPSFAELAFCCQPLVVGKVFGGFRDERVEIRCGLGFPRGCRCASHQFRWAAAAFIDETAPPKRAAIADSKFGPYASRAADGKGFFVSSGPARWPSTPVCRHARRAGPFTDSRRQRESRAVPSPDGRRWVGWSTGQTIRVDSPRIRSAVQWSQVL